jgi:hypothetical protein
MEDNDRREFDRLVRVREYCAERAGAFPAGSRGAQLFAALTALITELEAKAASQSAGLTSARTGTMSKAAARAALLEDVEAMRLTARAIALDNPDFANNFRLPPGRLTDQQLLATARAFAAAAASVKDEFIKYELPADFLEDLNADIENFERAVVVQSRSTDAHVAATEAIDEGLERGGDLVRQLDAVVRNKFRGDRAMLAAWTSASHVERAPRRKQAQQPTEAGK